MPRLLRQRPPQWKLHRPPVIGAASSGGITPTSDATLAAALRLWIDDGSVWSTDTGGSTPCTSNGDAVKRISDRSDVGNHAVWDGVGAFPTYRVAGIGSKKAGRGNGSDASLVTPLTDTLGDFTVFMVAQKPASADSDYFRYLDKIFSTGFFISRASSGGAGWHSGVRALGTDLNSADDTGPFVLCLSRSGSTKTLYIQGETTNATESVGSTAMSSDPLVLFNDIMKGAGTSGDIAAVTVSNLAMTTVQRAIYWTYFGTLYGITLSGVTPPASTDLIPCIGGDGPSSNWYEG